MAAAMKACIESGVRETDGRFVECEYSVMYAQQGENIEVFVSRVLDAAYVASVGFRVVRFSVWHHRMCIMRAMYALDARGCWQREMWL